MSEDSLRETPEQTQYTIAMIRTRKENNNPKTIVIIDTSTMEKTKTCKDISMY